MKYVWGAKVWHKIVGYGKHPRLGTNAAVCACAATIPLGAPVKSNPAQAPGPMCGSCANLSAAVQKTLQEKLAPKFTPIDGSGAAASATTPAAASGKAAPAAAAAKSAATKKFASRPRK